MKVEEVVKCSSYFDHKKDNPYSRIPYQKRIKYNGKSFKEIMKELEGKV